MQATTFEVVVIGGGPAGSTAAILLANAGWSVALIEKAQFPRRKVCGEYVSATNLPLLKKLGVLQTFARQAGPEIKQVGLFVGDTIVTSPMPVPAKNGWGRALGREHLDTVLLNQAAEAGAQIFQPWSVLSLDQSSDGFTCRIVSRTNGDSFELGSRLVIAAHGSWESGGLPSHIPRQPAQSSDLFGFKAHFAGAKLPPDLMPLLVFPGGYGGMVNTDGGRVSLSCCVRRDCLEELRRDKAGQSAGEAVLEHIKASCAGARECLAGADMEGSWMAAGPIRPGIRRSSRTGIFLAGNAAGEAHPIVAEGITMAMQSASLLSERLISGREGVLSGETLKQVCQAYERDWLRNFVPRTRAAGVFATASLHAGTRSVGSHLVKLSPTLLSLAAKWSGKTNQVG